MSIKYYDKTYAEVDIAPLLGEFITACNEGHAKTGQCSCMKSMKRTNTMQGFILTATMKCTLVEYLT